jgi:hypothetical protein
MTTEVSIRNYDMKKSVADIRLPLVKELTLPLIQTPQGSFPYIPAGVLNFEGNFHY